MSLEAEKIYSPKARERPVGLGLTNQDSIMDINDVAEGRHLTTDIDEGTGGVNLETARCPSPEPADVVTNLGTEDFTGMNH